MLRRLIATSLFLAGTAQGAIWPDHLGASQRKSAEPADVSSNPQTWQEYGLEGSEKAAYGTFRVAAYRFKDTTGAFAAAQWLQGSTVGNYVITCEGKCPSKAHLSDLFTKSSPPKLSHAAYPTLDGYLPTKDLIAGSQRYILGPASLALFAPVIPASAAAFDFSTEAQLAKYRTGKSEQSLVIFSFPTPQIARQQSSFLEKLPGVVVKRAGPMLAAVIDAPNPAAAAGLLSQVTYQASISLDAVPPLVIEPKTAAQMLLAIFQLAGIVLGFCALSGLGFGLARIVSKKFGTSDAGQPMITLHLGDK